MALSLLLLILLAAADGFRISNLFQQQSKNILAVQWPPNVCQVEKWRSSACDHNYWTIHGWWPPESDTKNEDDFSVTEIEDLVDNMEQVWPQLSGKNNTGFWKHEWDKHGKPGGLTVHQYFTKALDFFDKVLGNCTEPSKEIEKCLIEKGEVKKYRLIKRAREGEPMIEECTINDNSSQCTSVMKTKGNSDISFRRGRRGRHRSARRNRRGRNRSARRNRRRNKSARRNRRGRNRSRSRSKSKSARRNRRGRNKSARRGKRGRNRSRSRSKSRSGRRNRRGRNRSRSRSKSRSGRRGRRGRSRSRSRSNEHNSRSHQSNNQNEYYVVEARLVLPANFI